MARPRGSAKPVGDYGHRLLAAQVRAGLTGEQMARQLSISRQTYSRLLHGLDGSGAAIKPASGQRLQHWMLRRDLMAMAEALPAADEPRPKRSRPKKGLAPETPS